MQQQTQRVQASDQHQMRCTDQLHYVIVLVQGAGQNSKEAALVTSQLRNSERRNHMRHQLKISTRRVWLPGYERVRRVVADDSQGFACNLELLALCQRVPNTARV